MLIQISVRVEVVRLAKVREGSGMIRLYSLMCHETNERVAALLS